MRLATVRTLPAWPAERQPYSPTLVHIKIIDDELGKPQKKFFLLRSYPPPPPRAKWPHFFSIFFLELQAPLSGPATKNITFLRLPLEKLETSWSKEFLSGEKCLIFFF